VASVVEAPAALVFGAVAGVSAGATDGVVSAPALAATEVGAGVAGTAT
jgi:hypothetical protein